MEQLLWLYALPYDELYPLVCFDERPCFLIGETLQPIPMDKGRVRREHYTYTKHGSCCLLGAIEPLTGRRLALVESHRTKKEYAYFLKMLSEKYPNAIKIRLVQDNLNTHTLGALYENFPPAEAFALAQRFEFHYTPKGASWLNMIEIEFSAVSRQCLNRRIPCMDRMRQEIQTFMQIREQKQIKIEWQFSLKKARSTLNRHYKNVNPESNEQENI